MLTKSLRGNQNFMPILIFIVWCVGFFLQNVNKIDPNQKLLSFGLAATSVAIITWVVNGFPYFKKNYFFSFLFSVGFLLLGCCLENLNFYAGFLFLSIVIAQLLFVNQNEQMLFNPFDLGLYIGLAIIFYPPFWIFGVFLLLYFIFKGKTQIFGLVFSFLGMLTLFIVALELMAVFDAWYYWDKFKEQFVFTPKVFDWDLLFLVPILILGIMGVADYFSNINRQSANKKAVFFDAVLWFISGVVFCVLYGADTANAMLFILLPIVLYLSNMLTFSKVLWKSELSLWLFIVSLLLYRYHSYIEIPELFDSVTF